MYTPVNYNLKISATVNGSYSKHSEKKQRPLDLSVFNNHQRCFASYLERVTLTNQNKNTKTKNLINGEETFQEIKQKLKEAKSFIHLEYYIFRYDRLGQEIIDILMDKVQAGVEVRLIYDAFGSLSLSKSEIKKIEESGIKIQPFLPIKTGWYNCKSLTSAIIEKSLSLMGRLDLSAG